MFLCAVQCHRYAQSACVLVLLSRVLLLGHLLFLVRVLQVRSQSVECGTHCSDLQSPPAVSYPGWPAFCPVDSVVLAVPSGFSFGHSHFSGVVAFRCTCDQCEQFLSCVATMVLTQRFLRLAAPSQPMLETAGLRILALLENPQDVQNQCRRPRTPLASLQEEIVLAKLASCSSCRCHSAGPGRQLSAPCAHQIWDGRRSH